MKWQRNYRITIDTFDTTGGLTVIEPPFTFQFDIRRQAFASVNSAVLSIYNLSETTRAAIFQDRYYQPLYRKIVVEGGYGDELTEIFVGNIYEASSARQGTNIVTLIVAQDGGWDTAGTKSFKTLKGGLSLKSIIRDLIGDFPNLNEGYISDTLDEDKLKRPVVIDGNTFDAIRTYSNNAVFVDMQKVYVMRNNEVFSGETFVIDSDTGLLETPRREASFLTVVTLFEPKILMTQMVDLDATVQKQYNGKYKVIGVSHSGIISEAVNGKCQSSFNLLIEGTPFGGFKQVDAN